MVKSDCSLRSLNLPEPGLEERFRQRFVTVLGALGWRSENIANREKRDPSWVMFYDGMKADNISQVFPLLSG